MRCALSCPERGRCPKEGSAETCLTFKAIVIRRLPARKGEAAVLKKPKKKKPNDKPKEKPVKQKAETSGRPPKPVIMDGWRRFESLADANEFACGNRKASHLRQCLERGKHTVYGHRWEYADGSDG